MKITKNILLISALSAFSTLLYAESAPNTTITPITTAPTTPTSTTAAPTTTTTPTSIITLPTTSATPTTTPVITTTAAPVLTTATPTTPSASTNSANMSGVYQCTGTDPFQKNTYSFQLVTIIKNGDVYNVQWQDASGTPIMIGTGVTHPDLNNTFAVLYWPLNKSYYMLGLYAVKPDGSLQSRWIVNGQVLVGSETCKKTK